MTGQHAGTIGLSSGVLEFEKDALVGGQFEIDMTSIIVTDLEGEWKDKLEGHLKAPDFFGVEDFGTATFVITKVAPKGTPGDYKVTGDLTIKGITKEIRFYTNLSKDGLAVADITIDRTDYDIKYGSSSFFDSLGDKTIYDDFDLKISLVVQ